MVPDLAAQLDLTAGLAAVAADVGFVSFAVAPIGTRVFEREELTGRDIGAHDAYRYPERTADSSAASGGVPDSGGHENTDPGGPR